MAFRLRREVIITGLPAAKRAQPLQGKCLTLSAPVSMFSQAPEALLPLAP